MKKIWSLLVLILMVFFSCKESNTKKKARKPLSNQVSHAQGFSIDHRETFTVVTVTDPWPNAQKSFSYAFVPKDVTLPVSIDSTKFDAVISTPVAHLVVTSTTHIPALEALDGLGALKGFPDTKYISSMPARQLISKNKIKELGNNENLNTELVLEMQPEAIVGFAINNDNSTYHLLQKAGIPVLFNGDWTERTPLGKAEWIKFFGVLLGQEKKADSIFNTIANDYNKIKDLAAKASKKPQVLSGALYKDVWYAPAGNSWAAQFLADANADYLWANTKGTGSLSLSLESALDQGKQTDFWISPAQFTSYKDMEAANKHYAQFKAYKTKQVYSFAKTVGPTGGMLYYELAPQRPDWVLKDLVHILHPELLPNYEPYFFKPLE